MFVWDDQVLSFSVWLVISMFYIHIFQLDTVILFLCDYGLLVILGVIM